MKSSKSNLLMAREDYETLKGYVKGLNPSIGIDRNNAALLQLELTKAKVVKGEELPADVVRLNSRVIVKEERKNKLIEFVLVLPEKADIKHRLVSVFAPLGTALLGFRQGDSVKWDVPGGAKTFTIVEVTNRKV